MKLLTFLALPLLLFTLACKTEAAENAIPCEAGNHLNDLVSLPDGTALRVIEVNDYFCPCNVQCVWGGYLEVIVQAEGTNRGPDTIGWQNRVATYGDYAVTLGEIYNQPDCGGRLAAEAFCFEVRVE